MRHISFFYFLLLISCATNKFIPYLGYDLGNGLIDYQEEKIDEDIYRISLCANKYTLITQIEDFILLRAAEIAIEKNNSYFIVIDNFDESIISISGFGPRGNLSKEINKVSYLIKTVNEVPFYEVGYDAKTISLNIKKKYNIDM